MVRIRAAATTGRLTRNTAPQRKWSSSAPPTTGPSAAPPDATAAQMPMASALWPGSSKLWRMIDSVAGIIAAAPTASPARAAISAPGVGAKPAASEAAPKIASPIMNIRRWP